MIEYIPITDYCIEVRERNKLIGRLRVGAMAGDDVNYWHFHPCNNVAMSYRVCKVIMHKVAKLNSEVIHGRLSGNSSNPN